MKNFNLVPALRAVFAYIRRAMCFLILLCAINVSGQGWYPIEPSSNECERCANGINFERTGFVYDFTSDGTLPNPGNNYQLSIDNTSRCNIKKRNVITPYDNSPCLAGDTYFEDNLPYLENEGCFLSSPCARNFRNNGTCVGCIGTNGCTSNCKILPDLVVSPWSVGLGDVVNCSSIFTLDPYDLTVAVSISVANIGKGPFQIVQTGNHFCCYENCDEAPEGEPCCTSVETGTTCPTGQKFKEEISQVILKLPANPASQPMEYVQNPANGAYMIYHPDHGHMHIENWVNITLRKRPSIGNTDPLSWPVVSNVAANKMSFALGSVSSLLSAAPFMGTNIQQNEVVSMLDSYQGTSYNPWEDPAAPWWNDPNKLKRKYSDFPNYFLTGVPATQLGNLETQVISPGFIDLYESWYAGNDLMLPLPLEDDDYYAVIQVDPDNLFEEENENNNVTVVPIHLNIPANTVIPESNAIITDLYHAFTYDDPDIRWELDTRVNGTLVVENGVTFILQNNTVEFMTHNSGIRVMPGGTLIIDNATLTGFNGTDWAGIQCWGTLIIDGCVIPNGQTNQNAVITGNCGQSLTATQNSEQISNFRAYSGIVTPANYTQNWSANLLGTQTTMPATFSYNTNFSAGYTFVSTLTTGSLCDGTQLLCDSPSRIYQNAQTIPAISITGGGTTTYCLSQNPILSAPAGYAYTWSNGATSSSIAPTSSGTYTVTVSNAWGCSATAQKNINISTATVSITPSAPANCALSLATNVAGTASPPYSYQWNGNTALNNASLNVSAGGAYTVVVSNSSGCVATNSIAISSSQLWDTPSFSGTYTVGSMGSNSIVPPNANGNETWNTLNKTIIGTIVIPEGKTLTLNNTILTMRGYSSQIIVQRGGQLNLVGSTIKGDVCANSPWQGIRVLAANNATPYTSADPISAFTAGNNQYGLLSATQSTIKHARVGIFNGFLQSDNNTNNVGGIIKLDQVVFEDNGIGVFMAPTNFSITHPLQPHQITNCVFNMIKNTAFAPDYWHPSLQQPLGIWSKNNKLPNTLHNNKFVSTMPTSTTPQDKRGIGIRLDNVHAKIDAPANSPSPEFDGLFKGIDVSNWLTVQKFVTVQRQNFNNTRKSITLVTAFGSTISDNEFKVPPGTSPTLDTYGLMGSSSSGMIIQNNRFITNNTYVPNTKGAIIQASANGSTPSSMTNNLFDGNFEAGTQFLENNISLQTNCNAYDDCKTDWHLKNNATLPTQGQCLTNDASLALRTHWHYTTDPGILPALGSHFHIINDSPGFDLKLNIDNSLQSNPKMPTSDYVIGQGSVTVTVCEPLNANFINNSCNPSWVWPIFGDAKTSTECTNGNSLEQMLYDYIQQEQSDSLLLLLQCLEGEEWATQLLAGTYIDEGQYDMASAELQKLDSTSVENAEFIALCTAIMDSTLSSSEGGRVATALAQTQQIANNTDSKNKTLAEAVLSICRNADYVRHGEPINWKNNAPIGSNVAFNLVPNPAQDVVTIEVPNFTAPILLSICDISGREVKQVWIQNTHTTIPTQTLSNGIYICKLAGSNETQKLVIIK